MADDAVDLLDEVEESTDIQGDPFEICDFPQTLVTEKIIFVVDIFLLGRDSDNECDCKCIISALKTYFSLKKKICVKPPQFEWILYNNNAVLHSKISSEKDFDISPIQDVDYDDDDEPLKIDEVFHKIATLVEFPDPESSKKCLPPNWVYHVIWLFGRNVHIPTMQNTNSFDFLMMTPYFALDMLYLHDKKIKPNQCDAISEALFNLNENGKGYFLSASVSKKNLFPYFAQFLGHPLIRTPQSKAQYNIFTLHHLLEVVKNNNDKE